jgi:hypothetical protein
MHWHFRRALAEVGTGVEVSEKSGLVSNAVLGPRLPAKDETAQP